MADPLKGARPSATSGPFLPRVLGAIMLRRDLYEAVANDPDALRLAAAVVCLSAIAQNSLGSSAVIDAFGTWGLLIVMIFALIRWLVFTAVIYPFARMMGHQSTSYGRLLRCLGFAEAPAVVSVVAFLLDPTLFPWVRLVVWCWLLAATIVAVRAALATTTARAVLIGVAGFVVYVLIGIITEV